MTFLIKKLDLKSNRIDIQLFIWHWQVKQNIIEKGCKKRKYKSEIQNVVIWKKMKNKILNPKHKFDIKAVAKETSSQFQKCFFASSSSSLQSSFQVTTATQRRCRRFRRWSQSCKSSLSWRIRSTLMPTVYFISKF